MKDLRRNEIIDMLEMAEILFEEKQNIIKCDIPTLGRITYYPKADKVQINRNNTWREYGFEFIKHILSNTIKGQNVNNIANSLEEIKKEKIKKELRDDFAMFAMQSVITRLGVNPLFGANGQDTFNLVAEEAYKYADAMLKQREL